jgi:hypothetical protein
VRGARLALFAVVAGLVACGAPLAAGRPAGSIVLDGHAVELTVRGGSICAHVGGRRAAHCVTVPGRADGDVLVAAYEADGPTADLAVVVTAPGVAIGGLGPGAARAHVRLRSGRVVVLWLERRPHGDRRLCLTSGRPGAHATAVVVERTAPVAADGVVTSPADGCA